VCVNVNLNNLKLSIEEELYIFEIIEKFRKRGAQRETEKETAKEVEKKFQKNFQKKNSKILKCPITFQKCPIGTPKCPITSQNVP